MPGEPPAYAWVPNALTAARVGLVGLTYVAVQARHLPLFVVLVLFAVVTDILDGPVARRLKVAGRVGANLDSAADFAFYLSLPVWAYMWRPEEIRPHLPVIGGYAAVYLSTLLALRLRRGVLGLHNRYSRTAGTAGVFFALYTILWGWDDRVFLLVLAVVTLDLVQRAMRALVPSRNASPGARAASARTDATYVSGPQSAGREGER